MEDPDEGISFSLSLLTSVKWIHEEADFVTRYFLLEYIKAKQERGYTRKEGERETWRKWRWRVCLSGV